VSVACSPKGAGGEEGEGGREGAGEGEGEGEEGEGGREGVGGEKGQEGEGRREGAGGEDCFGIEYPPGEVHEVDDFEEANGFVVIVHFFLFLFFPSRCG
jgi:hypothetical protein